MKTHHMCSALVLALKNGLKHMSEDNERQPSFDEEDFHPEHHLANRINKIMEDEAYEGMTAMTAAGMLITLAIELTVSGMMHRGDREDGEDRKEGEGWKGNDDG